MMADQMVEMTAAWLVDWKVAWMAVRRDYSMVDCLVELKVVQMVVRWVADLVDWKVAWKARWMVVQRVA
jgi:hypothetical protein